MRKNQDHYDEAYHLNNHSVTLQALDKALNGERKEISFIVPVEWLEKYVYEVFGCKDVYQFLENYTWTHTEGMEKIAEEEGVLVKRFENPSQTPNKIARRRIGRKAIDFLLGK